MPSLPRSRVPRSLLFGTIALAVLLLVLATLQYRWLGQISEADEARLRAGARSRAEQLARDFDREVTRAFLWLHVDAGSVRSHDWAGYADRRARWARLTAHAGLVKDVWLVDAAGEAPQRFDPATSSFQPAPWPDSLVSLRERVHDIALAFSSPPHLAAPHASPRPGPSGASRIAKSFHRPSDLFDDQIPAFVAPIPSFEPTAPGRVGMSFSRLAGFTIVTFDLDYVRRRFLPALVERHFGADEDSDYAVVVSRRSDPQAVLFRSAPPVPGAASEGDATATLLGVRLEDAAEEDPAAFPLPSPAPSPRVSGRRVEPHHFGWLRRAGPGEPDAGHWRVVVTYRAGSVDQVVAAARRRNLGIGAGILALLTVSVVLIVVSSQRARRLADRQLEFVAGVSHELRTPVAVICSAGENLADGLVKEPAMVQQYGRVVRDEGRRLVEMVEQVLDFAGSYSGRRAYRFEELGISELVSECLEAVSRGERGLQVEANVEPGLPPVRADRGALRRAVQNLLQNAVKYGGEGGWIGVRVACGPPGERTEVWITVQDHGLGIPPSEVPRLFEPFFRGEEAQNRQIRGSGLGLSLVKRIVEAHGGRVGVESAPGRGSAFTIALPASPPLRPAAAPAGAEMAPPRPVPVSEPTDGTPHTAG